MNSVKENHNPNKIQIALLILCTAALILSFIKPKDYLTWSLEAFPVIVGVIVLIVVFYGGVSYGKNQTPAGNQGIQTFGQNGMTGGQRGVRGGGGGFVNGQIIAKDANSITIELRALGQNDKGGANTGGVNQPSTGGSKIVFYTNQTTISKTVSGSLADLTVGEQVNVTGTPNTDGSVNAQSVQIRPQTPSSVVK